MTYAHLIKEIKDRERRLRTGSAMLAHAKVLAAGREKELITQLCTALNSIADEERDAAVAVSKLAMEHSKEDFNDILTALGG